MGDLPDAALSYPEDTHGFTVKWILEKYPAAMEDSFKADAQSSFAHEP